MLVALAVIVEVVAVGMQNMKIGLGPCEGDVEQSPLLLDLGVRFGGQVGRGSFLRVRWRCLIFEGSVIRLGHFTDVTIDPRGARLRQITSPNDSLELNSTHP